MTSTFDTIRAKRDIKRLDGRPLPEDALRRILQAGRMAGSAKNTQPWRFVVVRDPLQKQKLAACGNFTSNMPEAAVAVAIVVLPDQGQWDPERATQFDAGRAAQNMMLTAWELGIGSCPNTMHRHEDALAVLGIPVTHRIAQVIIFGYPKPAAGDESPRRPRQPLDELVMHERWQE